MSTIKEQIVEPRATTSLHEVLDRTADRIASRGTQSESAILEGLAAAARTLCPGAAEALVDWEGPEIARLRAFGIVHGALLRELDSLISAATPGPGRDPSESVVDPWWIRGRHGCASAGRSGHSSADRDRQIDPAVA